ncbi:MAG: hypothetical protein JSS02_09430 [Planctomycetes bacterium]|nr:hypothetical protein [Planctomycetota bacterium]
MDPFRCLRVSQLLLDYQLHIAGEFEPAVQRIVVDATLTAFSRVVDQALERQVDCVLIDGECFDPENPGLRGPAALIRGLNRLAERGIAVIIDAPPKIWSAWPAGLRWPPYAHRLGLGLETSVPITRDGRYLGTVSGDSQDDWHTTWQVSLPDEAGATGAFQLSESAGPLTGLNPQHTGPHGCQYIEVHPEWGVQTTFLPQAPVRWERYCAQLSPEMSRDDLLQDLATQLECSPRSDGEQVRLVTWVFSGDHPLLDRLTADRPRQDFLDDLALLDPLPGVTVHTHAMRIRRVSHKERQVTPMEDLAAEFLDRLQNRLSSPEAAWRACLANSELTGNPWEVKLDSLYGDCDADDLACDARRLAGQWFAADEDLSS